MFRGKPAITKFDRLITPNRKSSQGFATPTGAALRRSAPSACSRLAHPASGLAQPTTADYLRLPKVRLAGWVNLLAHYAKGTLWPMRQLLQPTSGFELAAWRAAPLPSRYSTLPILELVSLGGRSPHLRPRHGLLRCRGQIRVERAARPRALHRQDRCQTFLPAAGSPTTTLCQLRSDCLRRDPGAAPPSGRPAPSHAPRFPSVMGGVCRA